MEEFFEVVSPRSTVGAETPMSMAVLADGEVVRVCRPRCRGSARDWGFAMYRASHDNYETSFLPGGFMGGSPEEDLDTACGLYLNDPTTWTADELTTDTPSAGV